MAENTTSGATAPPPGHRLPPPPKPGPRGPSRWPKILAGMSGLGLLSAFLVWGPCLPTWVVWGTALPVCQEGDLVPGLGVELFGIQRGGTGTVVVHPVAWWYRPDYRNVQMSRVGRASATVQLFGPGGGEIEIQSEELDDYNDDPAFQIRLDRKSVV